MKLVLATPLYPPDIAEPAPYMKELARRLASENEVVIATYGRFVEPIPGVTILTVDKRRFLPLRLLSYSLLLLRAARKADALYMENGPSVELPGIIVSLFTRTRLILHLGDRNAHARTTRHALLRTLENLARARATRTLETSPLERPEIIPFLPRPEAAFLAYARSWDVHLAEVNAVIYD